MLPPTTDVTVLKTELLSALPDDVAVIFKAELQAALGDNLLFIKTELLALKTELSGRISTMQSDFPGLKGTVTEMEQSLSTCTDDIVTLQTKVEHLSKELVKLENKCEDLESRARHQNPDYWCPRGRPCLLIHCQRVYTSDGGFHTREGAARGQSPPGSDV